MLASLNLPDAYLPHELQLVDGAPDIEGLRSLLSVFRSNVALRSLVISDPYKQIVLPMLEEIGPAAAECGSVNLISKRDGKLIGENLDGEAFALSVEKEADYSFRRRSMVFFGCGGLSSAIAMRLSHELSRVALVDINVERAEALARRLQDKNPRLKTYVSDRSEELKLRSYDIFYNGSGLGKHGANENTLMFTPLHAFDELPDDGIAFDANYTPWETAFIRRFASMGYRTMNGFFHMVAFSGLHLSKLTGKNVSYELVKDMGGFAIPQDSAWQ